jgi:DNA-binding GntR family transcriptional regulator
MKPSAPTPRTRAAPRYATVADALIEDIAAGRYPVGSLLPPEAELCARYRVSRHTVREAARRLVADGLITRQPGIGTTVRARTAQPQYTASIGSLDELMQYTQRTRLKLLSTDEVAAHGPLAQALDCPPGQLWFRLHTLRYADDLAAPISVTDIYVPPEFRAIERHFGGGRVAVYRLIEERFGERIVEVRQDIAGLQIPAAQAVLLGVRRGSAGLDVTRTYLGPGGRTVSISKNTYPAGRFRLTTRWRLQAA